MPEDDLDVVLHRARPSWSRKDLDAVRFKLREVGIRRVNELVDVLAKGHLNTSLKEAGLKTFGADTLQGLRQCLGIDDPSHGTARSAEHGHKDRDGRLDTMPPQPQPVPADVGRAEVHQQAGPARPPEDAPADAIP
eukprot:CAMPEP_0168461196 /NCGR_PEP_ID=MMETSP0228-20121227/53851_1 /TAXON_ID=133427 /ORGANISM="Protoceratium reticulatum, Strain CCCM 535 (=CCMP 1889)" /LENGTH=135 /DNA_ID=CAMNT_0008476485 /DNA_START=41 /DNA_END=445 /DNA_ORIENTATION=-